jgi:predicted nucleotidyltransferase
MQQMRSAVREESYNSVKVFWLDTDYIISRLRHKAKQLIRDTRVREVVLFGSLAEGRAVPGSDADLLIVVDDDGRTMNERIEDYLEFFSGIEIGIDVFPYSTKELENPLAKQALSKGIVLASRE